MTLEFIRRLLSGVKKNKIEENKIRRDIYDFQYNFTNESEEIWHISEEVKEIFFDIQNPKKKIDEIIKEIDNIIDS